MSVRRLAWLVVVASVAPLVVALAAQYVGGLAPCPLCVYQRIPYAVTAALGVLALVVGGRGARAALALAGLIFVGEAALALYHAGVEQGWFEGLAACGGAGDTPPTLDELRRQLLEGPPPPRCDRVPWALFGLSMAAYNALYAAALAAFTLAATWRSRGRRR